MPQKNSENYDDENESLNDSDDQSKDAKKKDEEILRVAKEQFKIDQEAWVDIHREALEDLRFRAGDQWAPEILEKRKKASRPALTINKIPQYERQITNEMRQNRPSIKVYPVDDKADPETAKILQGMIRNIEYSSNADNAYISSGEGAVNKGFGFFRIDLDYVSSKSFDQEIKIKSIPNHFSVLLDAASQEIDGSDANHSFVFVDMPKDEYKAQYPDSEISQMNEWRTYGDQDWLKESTCRVAEYFVKEFEKVKLCLLSDGSVIEKSEGYKPPEGLTIKKERESLRSKINWYLINGEEILERTEWLGSWIPIIPTYGARINVNGKWTFESVFRFSKDSQRMLNYMASSEAEAIALAPKAPYIIEEGQVAGYENMWKNSNTDTLAALVYKSKSISGSLVPPPQRNQFEPAVSAITNARLQASDDIKSTTGIYDASLGNRSNEQSGVAIARRNAQSQNSNYHFLDNLSKSIRHAGRICVELIPKIYDSARIERTIGEDGTHEIVKINQDFEKAGEIVRYDLSAGKYDVVIETGPSYATKRQESAEMLMEFSKAMPQHAGNIADLIAKNMDWPGASEMAERFRKLLPPGLIEDKEKKRLPPEVQQQLQQMQQMIERLTGSLKEKTEQANTKIMDLESKERIEFAKLQHDLTVQTMKINHGASETLFAHEAERLNQRLSYLEMNQPINAEDAYEEQDQFINQNLNESGNQAAIQTDEDFQ